MRIEGSRILVLGGWGLVGNAICHKLMEHSPSKLFISSLKQAEAEDAVEQLRKEYKNVPPDTFQPFWGNLFTRNDWKDITWHDIMNDTEKRRTAVDDIFDELNDEIKNNSFLYSLINQTKPDLVIDCINTATAIAYLNIYDTVQTVKTQIRENNIDNSLLEKMLGSIYIPQLIRHIQLVYQGLKDAGCTMYMKIGTSGTGGMGLNIPYTHSEERPSRVLLSKTAVAGAQTLLNFLMARTPGNLMIKEIKPSAAIAWKRIAFDKVRKAGKTIQLYDMAVEDAHKTEGKFDYEQKSGIKDTGKEFESVFIDTGENGIFSKGEFRAIGSLGQMEIVTPEEIAEYTVYEILGGNSGKDVIQGLDAFVLGPTYRGGMLFNEAIRKIEDLEKEHGIESTAFELLGPPRLSKLLYEAHIIKRIAENMNDALAYKPNDLANEALKLIKEDSRLKSQIISIGLPILLPDGKSYLRGREVKIPKRTKPVFDFNPEAIDKWCFEGWIDLRPKNFEKWQSRIKDIIEQAQSIPANDTSSRYTFNKHYWDNFNSIDEGKIAGWIFQYEDKGWRFKR